MNPKAIQAFGKPGSKSRRILHAAIEAETIWQQNKREGQQFPAKLRRYIGWDTRTKMPPKENRRKKKASNLIYLPGK